MLFKIKLSEIRKVIEGGNAHYICHAIRDKVRRDTDGEIEFIWPKDVFLAFQKVMPTLFVNEKKHHHTIISWMNLNKVPNKLRVLAHDNMVSGEYRIELLNWMVSKIGDQTITVRAYRAN